MSYEYDQRNREHQLYEFRHDLYKYQYHDKEMFENKIVNSYIVTAEKIHVPRPKLQNHYVTDIGDERNWYIVCSGMHYCYIVEGFKARGGSRGDGYTGSFYLVERDNGDDKFPSYLYGWDNKTNMSISVKNGRLINVTNMDVKWEHLLKAMHQDVKKGIIELAKNIAEIEENNFKVSKLASENKMSIVSDILQKCQ